MMHSGLLTYKPTLHSALCARPLRGTESWRGGDPCCCLRRGVWRASSQGFGPESAKKNKKLNSTAKIDDKQSEKVQMESRSRIQNSENPSKDDAFAPTLSKVSNMQQEKMETTGTFEERLEAIRRSAEEKRRREQEKRYGPIDYEASSSTQDSKAVSLPVKVGIGIGVVVFGLIFAFGDFLPSGQVNVQKTNVAPMIKNDSKDAAKLQEQLQSFLAISRVHPEDTSALEGVAVTYAQLGDFPRSETALLELLEKKPSDVEALRLLGEVQNALGKFRESTSSYRQALKVSPRSITLWKGLAEALVLQGKPDSAVEELRAERDRLGSLKAQVKNNEGKDEENDEANLVQINLLLGKTYAEWGHTSDALAVYDSIIKGYPEDFRGYLAKGILLKNQDRLGEAERMFIQAKYFAPEKMKVLVDRYSKT